MSCPRPESQRKGWLQLTGLQVIALVAVVPAQGIAKITTIQLPKGSSRVHQALHRDLNGDGRPDLILAVGDSQQRRARSIRIHYRAVAGSMSPFAQTPDLEIAVPSSVTAFAIGDVHPDTHAELIWFGSRGVYCYRPNAAEQRRTTKLIACEFLFQYADSESVLSWQTGVIDLNGDGLVDFILPERNGYRIGLQRRGEDGARHFDGQFLKLPERTLRTDGRPNAIRGSGRGNTVRISLDIGTGTPKKPLVDISHAVPTPKLADWDGDGDLDLIVKHGDRVLVWTREATGKFSNQARFDLEFPLDGERTRLDPSFSTWLTDFNKDGRADSILFTKDRDSEEVRTHVMFFEHTQGKPHPLYHQGTPQQLLVIAGFLSSARLEDVDGDGWPDLQVAAWRLDALDQIQGSKTIDVEFYVYLNKRGRFSRRPDLIREETIETGTMSEGGGNKIFARFLGDVNGDGIRELLVRSRPDHIKLLMVRKRDGKLSILKRPIHEMSIAKKATLKLLTGDSKHLGFLVLEGSQVLLVTY